MIVYPDASAVLKLHVNEPDSSRAQELLTGTQWITASHTYVEVRRNLARVLSGAALDNARMSFHESWDDVEVVELAWAVVERSAILAEETGARSLDALHLGAAESAGAALGMPVVTFDRGLAGAARSLGWTVLPE